jgi:hypothetical protein
MSEGTRKLDLTLRVADRLITLSTVVSDCDKEGAESAARSFNRWAERTRKILAGNVDENRVTEFDKLPKPAEDSSSSEEISAYSRRHADFLREIVDELDEA